MLEDDILDENEFDNQTTEMKQSYLSKLDEILEVLKDRKVCPSLGISDDRLISSLTVDELKNIIRDIIRTENMAVPVQPIQYTPMPAFYQNQPWCKVQTDSVYKEQING